jgi:LuxR family maltose regulon positive regulatory protein
LPISPDDVRTLESRTEGWITGLQLAAVAMQGLEGREQVARFIHNFGGSHRYIIDYLVDEVLDRQTLEVQEFLLRTSILDRMVAPLCNVVASREDSQAILERLEAANLFLIPLDGERRWYRYHHLFADLLRQRLQQSPPSVPPASGGDERGGVAELHIRASAWYEENGLEIEALHHAAAANDFERAARLVEGDGTPLHFRGAVTPVLNWLESLPTSLLDARPSLWVMYAEALGSAGRFANVEEVLQAAEAALQDAKPDTHTQDLLGCIASLRATILIGQRQIESVIALSRRALDLLRPDNFPVRAATTWVLGYGYQLRGDRAAASQAFAEAVAISQATENTIVAILAITGLGKVQAAENRIRQAAQTYQRALQLAGEHPLPLTAEAYLGLAHVCYEWNDLDAAQHHGQQSVQLARQIETSDIPIAGQAFLARLKLAQGDVAGAAAFLDEANQSIRQHHFIFRVPEVAAV